MKKKNVYYLVGIFLLLSPFFVTCQGDDITGNEVEKISFTEYLLDGTSCQWTNLKYDNQEVININASGDLEKYITCTEGALPEIDFSKHTLLVASGAATNGIAGMTEQLYKIKEGSYRLDIDIALYMTAEAPKWAVAILLPKISRETPVSLNIKYHH